MRALARALEEPTRTRRGAKNFICGKKCRVEMAELIRPMRDAYGPLVLEACRGVRAGAYYAG